MIEPTLITAPTVEAVSLAETKRQLRLDVSGTAEDDVLNTYRVAAREWFEWATGRTVHQAIWEYALDAFPAENYITLPRATPLISITSLKYKNSDGNETTWPASNYIADSDAVPGRIVLAYNNSWPSFTAYPVSPIRIRYTAGIATASPITEAAARIKIPILMLAHGLYQNREPEVVTDRAAVNAIAMHYGVRAFIAQNVVSYVF